MVRLYLVLALPVLLCPQVFADVIQYDDGTMEYHGGIHGQAVRFTMPSGSEAGWALSNLIMRLQYDSPAQKDTVYATVWTDNGGQQASAIGSVLYSTTDAMDYVGFPGWYTFDLSAAGLVVQSGDTVIAGWNSDDYIVAWWDGTTPQARSFRAIFSADDWDGPDDFTGTDNNAPVRLEAEALPEPTTCALYLLGLATVALRRRIAARRSVSPPID